MYVVTVNFRIKLPHVASFRAAVLRQAKNSLEREADCTRFDVFVSPDDEGALFLLKNTPTARRSMHIAKQNIFASSLVP